MNYLNEKEITFDQLKRTALKNYNWALICVIFLIGIEILFYIYPPRGYNAEDCIVLGSIKGQPLLSVEKLWQSKVKDDKFMLKILSESKIIQLKSHEENLKFIDNQIRPNLHFSMINSTLFKISFIQSSTHKIRPFLNTFTRNFIEQATLISNENLQKKRQNTNFAYQQLLQRSRLTHNLFALKVPLDKIIPNQNCQVENISYEYEDSFPGKLGIILINELNWELFKNQRALLDYTDKNQKVLSLFPFTIKRLTDPGTPPKPVQPYLFVFYFFIAAAVCLIYISGLFYFLPYQNQEEN